MLASLGLSVCVRCPGPVAIVPGIRDTGALVRREESDDSNNTHLDNRPSPHTLLGPGSAEGSCCTDNDVLDISISALLLLSNSPSLNISLPPAPPPPPCCPPEYNVKFSRELSAIIHKFTSIYLESPPGNPLLTTYHHLTTNIFYKHQKTLRPY